MYSLFLLLLTMAAATPIDRELRKVVPIVQVHPANITTNNTTHRELKPTLKIVGGTTAGKHTFPYQVAIVTSNSEGTTFCGGSLVSEEWILSAAHCFTSDGASIKVTLGAQDFLQHESSEVVITGSNVVTHPKWNRMTLLNDLALLRLSTRIILDHPYISPVRLPSLAQKHQSFASWKAVASGWGKVSSGSSDISYQLMYANLTILKNSECEQYFGEMKDTLICTSGSGPVGPCTGDSGGPLVIEEEDGQRTQVGIVSYGAFNCEAGYPTVYTRVSSYCEWISAVTGIQLRNGGSVTRSTVDLLVVVFFGAIVQLIRRL